MSRPAAAQRWLRGRAIAWAARRQGVDPVPVMLHRRRIYILPTGQGMLYGLSVLAMLLASLNYNNNLGLLLTFLLAGIGVAAMYRCQHNLAGLVVHVQPAPPVFAGETLQFPVLLHHDGGQYRFAISGAAKPVDVPVGRGTIVPIAQPTRRRGRQPLKRFSLSTTFPLGLFRAWVWIETDVAGLAWPRPAAMPAASAPAPAQGVTAGANVAGDDDFAGLRAWREGDSIRHVDWHAVARGRGLLTKQFSAGPPSLEFYDLAALGGLPIEQALSRLARSVLNADAAGSTYGLRLGDRTFGPDSGAAHRERCLSAMALFQV
ncbi:MAG TPA: DUF58 domain-containing protein [Gammaproteobacteria bacterium]|nr:DUF58 domain-containing protein [Gammaproteobacteria bacterium]